MTELLIFSAGYLTGAAMVAVYWFAFRSIDRRNR